MDELREIVRPLSSELRIGYEPAGADNGYTMGTLRCILTKSPGMNGTYPPKNPYQLSTQGASASTVTVLHYWT